MTFEQFVLAVLRCAEERLGKTAVVERQKILKNNGRSAVGIAIRRPGERIAPVFYLEEPYERYCRGESVEQLTQQLLQIFADSPAPPVWDYNGFPDYECVRSRIVYKLVNAQQNERFLEQVPHLRLLDLAVVFYVMIAEETFQNCSVLIRNAHLDLWKIPITELYESARRNTPILCPYILRPLEDFADGGEELPDCRTLVLTNRQGVNGAAALLYPQLPKIIGEKVGGNYFLLPSSIHEFLIVPEMEGISAEQLARIVCEVNRTEVSPEDVLSDGIYYFDGHNITEM